jgi:hypothetical protein
MRRRAALQLSHRAPWTVAGGPDPDYGDGERRNHHTCLTDPALIAPHDMRWRSPSPSEYDSAVRQLGHVWDCAHDGTANVTGYRCARCGRTHAEAARSSKS